MKLRKDVLEKDTWNTTDIFENKEDWEIKYNNCIEEIKSVEKYKNILNEKSENLFGCLKNNEELRKKIGALYVYANMKHHEDTAEPVYQNLTSKVESLEVKINAATSFINSEILSIGKEKINEFVNEKEEYKLYTHFFENIFRMEKHILDLKTEELLAKVGEIAGAPDNIYSILTNADMTFGNVKNEEGKEVTITDGNFISLLQSKSQEVRKNTFKTYYKSYTDLKNTLATTFNGNLKQELFFAEARKFNSSLEANLSANNIPTEVYTNLIKTVHEYLPLMHKYMDIRKEKLGLEELHIYDIYTPLIKNVELNIPYEEAKEKVLSAVNVLGEDYTKKIEEAFNNRWIDVYENKGKLSGAYSWGTYTAHPYVLLNYNNKIGDMFTLAHEMGHAIHSSYTWETQEYVYEDYTIFLAEVASTVNETLLIEYLKETSTDKVFKEYLVNYFIEKFRTTVFRQTMFAEFELIVHERNQKNESLTIEDLNNIYRDLNRKYYGENIILDEEINIEWARIHHFYTPFYVYQYATGFSSAVALSKNILKNGQEAVDKYLNFLKSGSKDYSINLLKKAGVDMSTPEPIREALEVFKELISEMESL